MKLRPQIDKPWLVIWLTLFLPFGYLVYQVITNDLGADPAKYVVSYLGRWGLTSLAVVLMVTPFSKVPELGYLIRYRRMIGLFCFFYLSLHVLGFLVFIADQDSWIKDIVKRPYILIGAVGYCIIFVLAVTSNRFSMRKLGKKWKKIHRWIYLSVILGIFHFFWLTRSNYFLPIVFATWVGVLLGLRIYWYWKRKFS